MNAKVVLFCFLVCSSTAVRLSSVGDVVSSYADAAHKVHQNEVSKRPTDEATRQMVEDARERDDAEDAACKDCNRFQARSDDVPTVTIKLDAAKMPSWERRLASLIHDRDAMVAYYTTALKKEFRKQLKARAIRKKQKKEKKRTLLQRGKPQTDQTDSLHVKVAPMKGPSAELVKRVIEEESKLTAEEKAALDKTFKSLLSFKSSRSPATFMKTTERVAGAPFHVKAAVGSHPFVSVADEVKAMHQSRVVGSKKFRELVQHVIETTKKPDFVQRSTDTKSVSGQPPRKTYNLYVEEPSGWDAALANSHFGYLAKEIIKVQHEQVAMLQELRSTEGTFAERDVSGKNEYQANRPDTVNIEFEVPQNMKSFAEAGKPQEVGSSTAAAISKLASAANHVVKVPAGQAQTPSKDIMSEARPAAMKAMAAAVEMDEPRGEQEGSFLARLRDIVSHSFNMLSQGSGKGTFLQKDDSEPNVNIIYDFNNAEAMTYDDIQDKLQNERSAIENLMI